MRVVIDTVIFVRSLINANASCARIVFAYATAYQLYVSEPVVAEVLEVLRRPGLTRKYHALAGRDHQRILELLEDALVVHLPSIPSVSRDPIDDMFLATALAARADYLVTEDKDLLVLGDYEGTTIIDCAAFLRIIEPGNNG